MNAKLKDEVLLAFGAPGDRALIRGQWPRSITGDSAAVELKEAVEQRVEVTFGDATSNIFGTGGSGSGKSRSLTDPLIERFCRTGCSGLVLSVKGTELAFADRYPRQIEVVGASARAVPVNIIGGMDEETLRAFLERLTENHLSHDRYFGTLGKEYALFVVMTFRLMGRSPTLACIHRALSQPEWFVSQFDPWFAQQKRLPEGYESMIHSLRSDAFSILVMGESNVVRDVDDARGDVPRQYAWQTNALLAKLRAFAMNPALRHGLCNAGAPALDFTDLLYKRRKIVITDVPYSRLGQAAHVVNDLLRIRMRAAVLNYPPHRDEGYGVDRFTFLLVDEYRQYVDFASSASTSGLLDDNTWCDRSREYGHCNVFITQGVSSLLAQLPRECRPETLSSLLQNMGTTISFASHDPHTVAYMADAAATSESARETQAVLANLDVGHALLVSHRLSRHHGPLAVRVKAGPIAGCPHMGVGLRGDLAPIGRDAEFVPASVSVANQWLSSSVVESLWADSFERRRETLARLLEKMLHGGRMPAVGPVTVRDDPRGRGTRLLVHNHDEQLCVELSRSDKVAAWILRVPLASLGALYEGVAIGHAVDHGALGSEDSSDTASLLPWTVCRQGGYGFDSVKYCIAHDEGFTLQLDETDWAWVRCVTRLWEDLIYDTEAPLKINRKPAITTAFEKEHCREEL